MQTFRRASSSEMTRTLIIGDIHGCIDELKELVDRVGPDRVVSVGDMVDRGPDSPAVWRFFAEREDADAVLGNHEQKCLRWHRGELPPALSQRITRKQHGTEAAWAEACAWFASLPRWIELDDVLVVHGFWQPGLSVEEQHPSVITGTMSGEKRVDRLDRPWYELYDGDKPLVVGHAIYDEANPLVHEDRVFGLDAGCVHGLRLTGLVVPDFQLVSVPARADHWTAVKAEHPDLRFAGVAPVKLEWAAARKLLPILRGNPLGAAKAAELGRLLADADAAAVRLLTQVEAEHAAAEAKLEPGYDGSAYAQAIRGSRIARLLHVRRTQGFTREDLEAKWRRPAGLVAYVESALPTAA